MEQRTGQVRVLVGNWAGNEVVNRPDIKKTKGFKLPCTAEQHLPVGIVRFTDHNGRSLEK